MIQHIHQNIYQHINNKLSNISLIYPPTYHQHIYRHIQWHIHQHSYSARILKLPLLAKNFKITLNAHFLKFQNMIVYILYELFWYFVSKVHKNQVKLLKIVIFVSEIWYHYKKLSQYASKISIFQNVNKNTKITHINEASTLISSSSMQFLYIFECSMLYFFGNIWIFLKYASKTPKTIAIVHHIYHQNHHQHHINTTNSSVKHQNFVVQSYHVNIT